MKKITLADFKKINYNPKNISNYRLIDGKCFRCGKNFEYSNVKKFLRNRINTDIKLWDSCQKCYLIIKTSENKEWINKNRKAQLISQNKPEQKTKNAIGVSKSWTQERRNKASQLLKDKWKNDPEFAKVAKNNITYMNDNYILKYNLIKKSIGIGGLRGMYKNIPYDSALELSFILWCESEKIKIKRYDLSPIKYNDENGICRLYFPDFIINNNEIIEIKGLGLFYYKNFQRNILKIEAANKINKKYKVILSNDKCVKKFYKLARRIHYENQKKESNKL